MPEVTAIIPTRNRSRHLERALRSVLSQQGVDLEVLVIDDGSTDATVDVVSRAGHEGVRLIRHDAPQGVSAARNRGIAEARGEWIAFLDDDDLWAPAKLSRQIAGLRETGRRWAYAGEVLVDDELRLLGGAPPPSPDEVIRSLHRFDAVPGGVSNVVVHADLLARVGPFDIGLRTSEDWDLWIRLAREGPPWWVRSALVAISLHRGNASRNTPVVIEELRVVERRYGLAIDWPKHYRWAAWLSLLDGRRFSALRYYARAIFIGDVASVARATVALVWPGYANWRLRRRPRAGDPWLDEAREWLEALVGPQEDRCAPL